MALLEIENLSVSFTQYTKGLQQQSTKVLHDLQLSINTGEVLTVIGSSGSGKSILAHAILGILPSNSQVTGTMRFDGEELTPAKQEELRGHQMALVPQSIQFLDPLMRVGQQVRHSVKAGDPVAAQREIFSRYQLKSEVERFYPFQLSGGMARRILVSTATVSKAKLIIADEPTPGLDPSIVKEALQGFRELADQGCAVLLISHDIGSAITVSDRVAVLYAGTSVEIAIAEDFSEEGERLRHPYTQALWRALPQNGFVPIQGTQPPSGELPPGCVFSPRCFHASKRCGESPIDMRKLRDGMVRCIHAS